MIPQNKKPLSSLVERTRTTVSRATHRGDKWHYKGTYRAKPIFRIERVKIWLPATWIQETDSASRLRNKMLPSAKILED